MIPDERLGIAVLTNQESEAAFEAIAFRIADHYLEAPATDWIDTYQRVMTRLKSATGATDSKTASARNTASKPSLPLARYAGTYSDGWYGDITIAQEGEKLVMRFSHTPDLVGDMEHWQYDTFAVRWRNRELRADAFVTFALTPEGSIDSAKMKAMSPSTDFSYDFQDLLLKP
jgi:hypothetical protein